MYLSFYSLREWPFALSSDTRFFYESSAQAEVRRQLREGIFARQGLLTLTGPAGSGKTFLLQVLREELKSQILFGHIPDPRSIGSNLLEFLADQFGLTPDPEARISLPTRFHSLLQERHHQGQVTTLVVDRADEMDQSLLSSLCLLAHHEESGVRLLQIVLSGRSDLERRLKRLPGYSPAAHRVRVSLPSLTADEAAQFIQIRLRRAGAKRSPFTPAAIQTLFAMSDGNPGSLCRLCDGALLAGYEAGLTEISDLDINQTALDYGLAEGPFELERKPITTPATAPPRPVTQLIEKLAEPLPTADSASLEPPSTSALEKRTAAPLTDNRSTATGLEPVSGQSTQLEKISTASLVVTERPAGRESRWMAALLLLLVTVTSSVYFLRQYFNGPPAPTSPAARATSLSNTLFQGKLHPSQEWKAVAPQASVVRNLSVKIGDQVKVGQVLLILDEAEARRTVELARIERDLARQERDQLALEVKTGLPSKTDVATATGEVAVAQRRAESVPVPQRQDSVERARIVFEQARIRLQRYERLYREGLVSRDKYDEYAAAYSLAETDLQAAEEAAAAQKRLVSAQQKQTDKTSKVAAQEDAADQRRRVGALETAIQRLERTEAELKLAEQRLTDCTVRATADGHVIAIPVGIGDQVASGNTLMTFARLDTLVVRVPVAAPFIDALHVGDPAQVILPTLPPETVPGKVVTLNPVPDPDGTHRVEIEIVRPQQALLVGQPAEVRFLQP
ncbi:MAG: efflux RND transporter periplasmic adaptor subunit [Acidobacteria bacterium]|nr:efflux RND transporter periplasmic adaptor subunit [Acidobacteriota bacterium]